MPELTGSRASIYESGVSRLMALTRAGATATSVRGAAVATRVRHVSYRCALQSWGVARLAISREIFGNGGDSCQS